MDEDKSQAAHRPSAWPDEALDLGAAAQELLGEAGRLRSGRSGRTLTPGKGARVKQSLLALKAGQRLQDHPAPGTTTLIGLHGTAMLHHGSESVTLTKGVWAACPIEPHSVEAVSDTVILITVAHEGDRAARSDATDERAS